MLRSGVPGRLVGLCFGSLLVSLAEKALVLALRLALPPLISGVGLVPGPRSEWCLVRSRLVVKEGRSDSYWFIGALLVFYWVPAEVKKGAKCQF